MRNLMLILLLVPLMLFLPPASQATATYPLPSGISIDGNRQVYTAWHEKNWDIFLQDIPSGEITRITDEPHTQVYPDIWDKYIVWQDKRDNPDFESFSIYLYNIETQSAQRISPATEASHEEPIIADGKVVWSSLGLNGKDIYLHDISSGDTEKITTAGYSIAGMKFDGHIVAWLDLMTGTNDLYVYNTDTRQKTRITSGKDVSLVIAVNGGRVAWSEKIGENRQIQLFDSSNMKTRSLTSGKGSYMPVSINSNYLLASNNNQDNLIDLATGKETSINPAIADPDYVLLHDNRIIWVKEGKVATEPLPNASPGNDAPGSSNSSPQSHNSQPVIIINNQKLEVPVIVESGTTLVPIRDIFQALGAEVYWDEKTQTITAIKGSTTAKLQIGSKTAYRNGIPVTLQVPGQVSNGKAIVPLRFVSEALGTEVNWDGATQTITINSKDTSYPKSGRYTLGQIRRALACGAVYKRVEKLPYDRFLTWENVPKFIANAYVKIEKEALYQSWGVDNREEAIKMLNWLRNEGHRKTFDEIVVFVKSATEEDYQNFYNENKDSPEYINYLNFVRDHINEVSDKGILAWDYCRLVNLATEFYMVGYITKEEAINEIIYAAKVLQDTFSSWEEMAQNHLFGRQYWGKNILGNEFLFKPAIEWLLTNDESPWETFPWNYRID